MLELALSRLIVAIGILSAAGYVYSYFKIGGQLNASGEFGHFNLSQRDAFQLFRLYKAHRALYPLSALRKMLVMSLCGFLFAWACFVYLDIHRMWR